MDKVKRLEMYKENYYYNLELINNLNSKLIIPSSLFLFLGAVTNFLYKKLLLLTPGWESIVFIVAFIGFIISLLIGFYHLLKALKGRIYYMPPSLEIEKYWNELGEVYKETNEEKYKEFYDFLISAYCNCNNSNLDHIFKIGTRLRKFYNTIIVAVILVCIAIIPIYSQTFYSKSYSVIYDTVTKEAEVISNNNKQ